MHANVKWLWQILLVAVLYCLAAMLGNRLAVASGNISPVWPATGIAIAAVYLGGFACLEKEVATLVKVIEARHVSD